MVRSRYAELLKRTVANGLITHEQFRELDRLRRIRNPYVHVGSGRQWLRQTIDWLPLTYAGKPAKAPKVEQKAKAAVRMLLSFLRDCAFVPQEVARQSTGSD